MYIFYNIDWTRVYGRNSYEQTAYMLTIKRINHLISFLAGCSYKSGVENVVTGEEEDAPQGERNPVTLTFWLPCEEGTTDDTVALVEAAINKELKAQFTTAIELKVFPIDEYMKAVDELLSKIEKVEADKEQERIQREIAKSLRAEGITTKPQTTEETETTEVQTTRDEDGVVEL